MKRVTVLFSGGLDSYACLLWAIERWGSHSITALYISAGQPYATKELLAASKICNRLSIPFKMVVITPLQANPDTGHIPFRNTKFILEAASQQPQPTDIIIGCCLWDRASEDCTPEFMWRMQCILDQNTQQTVFNSSGQSIRLWHPFLSKPKHKIIERVSRFTAYKLEDALVGCYSGKATPCNACSSCFNLWLCQVLLLNIPLEWCEVAEWALSRFNRPNCISAWIHLKTLWQKRNWALHTFTVLNKYSKRVHGRPLKLRRLFLG